MRLSSFTLTVICFGILEMAEAYPGPFCQDDNITKKALDNGQIQNPIKQLLNGHVIEINYYLENQKHSSNDLFNIITQLAPHLKCTNVKSLKNKITRLCDQKKNLISKKKVPGVKNVKDLMCKVFVAPLSQRVESPSNQHDNVRSTNTINQIEKVCATDNPSSCCTRSVGVQASVDDIDYDNLSKETNLLQYMNSKKEKYSHKLDRKINENSDKLSSINSRIGHYSTRNVNKRDETAKKNLHCLREAQRQLLKKETCIKSAEKKISNDKMMIETLLSENKSMKEKITVLSKSVEESSKTNVVEKSKKMSLQKVNSYLRNETKTLRQKLKQSQNSVVSDDNKCVKCENYNMQIHDKENQIVMLEDEINVLKSEKITTKNEDGSYSNDVRLCVIELSGLEVAVEKVSSVIKTVSLHLFGQDFQKTELPSNTTVQTIVDEGHFIAKTFISSKLETAENWGINRDGTTRRKQKILDTSVTLDSGDVISLGFNRVARETAVTINDITKRHIKELAVLHVDMNNKEEMPTQCLDSQIQNPIESEVKTQQTLNNNTCETPKRPRNELSFNIDSAINIDNQPLTPKRALTQEYVVDSLSKLAFTMSDRASNEKLADKLLNEWRDEMLTNCDDDQKHEVHNFHCMAHVLLGFHKYSCDDLKVHESKLVNEMGPLGRDVLPVFKYWSKKGTIVERILRTTSDTFAPVGDHLGLRDRWEAYCAVNGIKSIIGNYKDNRFNAIFQTAAEVFVHTKDFLKVMDTVKAPNLKLKAVEADLKSDVIHTLVQSFGLIYVKITGPYWNLVTSGEVAYMELYPHIQEIAEFLKKCTENPQLLMTKEGHWSSKDPLEISNVTNKKRYLETLFSIEEDNKDRLFNTISIVTAAMLRTVEKQLVDFLPGGKYGDAPLKADLKRTSFAHTTNLGCEHHFGDLDSSQKRRPNGSMHHHSTVQMLKRNRVQLMYWLKNMPCNRRTTLFKSAKTGGRALRELHMDNEKNVLIQISEEMSVEKQNPKKRRKKNIEVEDAAEEEEDDYEQEVVSELPTIKSFTDNEYVAVAYQDAWYPGCVIKTIDSDSALVNFMIPCKKAGCFVWPSREDQQVVRKDFVLKRGFIPQCLNSGRQWYFPESGSIQSLYNKYSKVFF